MVGRNGVGQAGIGRAFLACGVALAAMLAIPGAADARTSVYVGVGPVWPAYPPPRHYYYPPPPVYVVPPPPVVYYEPAPPPAVVFTQPQPGPVTVNPAGPSYTARSGQLCREYQTTLMIGGVPQPSHGTACRQPDGTWRMMN